MTSPSSSTGEVDLNSTTVWTATPKTSCPNCTTKWSVTDANNPSPTAVTGTNPWNKIFTTVGQKIVSAQISSGAPCTKTVRVVSPSSVVREI